MKEKKNIRVPLIDKMIQNVKDGDRVVWIIVIILMLISMVAIFSSTSSLAIRTGVSRAVIFSKHIAVVAAGLAIILICSAVPNIKIFRWFSKWGFLLSLVLLVSLVAEIKIGDFVKVVTQNEATRAIRVGGFSIQVYEVAKVAMVMYLAWAVQAYDSGSFKLTNWMADTFPKVFGWMKSAVAQRWMYISGPILIIMVLIFPGSTGSAILTGIIMFVTVILGGMKWKDVFNTMAIAAIGVAILIVLHIVSSGAIIKRMQTVFNRFKIELPYPDATAREKQRKKIEAKSFEIHELTPGTKEFNDYIDNIRQPYGAEIAIVQGGRAIVGKGPGKSTQKYIVPVMFEDYMFSLIVEEYGLGLGFIVIIMYMSLFARGMIITKYSTNRYAKACVGGLVFLITFQALFHVLINCNIGIVTGQTLPLISHGRCSFLCFCIAFGVILQISVMVKNKIRKEQQQILLEKQIENESNN